MIGWKNGELLPLSAIQVDATDRGFLLGDGFFETMAANQGHIALFDAHMKRLEETAGLLGMTLPYQTEEIEQAITDVLVGCQLQNSRAALRLSVSRGSGPRGLTPPLECCPQMILSASEAPDHYPAARLKTSDIRRNEFSPTSQIKSLCYLDNILAFQDAHAHGADDALLLNTQGHICETTICNIFFIQDSKLLTPPISDGCLPGVMRQEVLNCAPALGLEVIEASLSVDMITNCEEAFLTNSLMRIRAIHEIDTHRLPSQHWTEKLLETVKQREN